MRFQHTKNIEDQFSNQHLISKNLSALLRQNNLNANQLAQLIGIPMMTVRRLVSGETEDPRISTLKIIADYFNIPVDLIISGDPRNIIAASKKIKSYSVPKVTWEMLPKLNDLEKLGFNDWNDWQSFSLNDNDRIGNSSFALESRPSMYPRFPKGTIFIIDPDTTPTDGDIVLIKIKENTEFTLKELIIDPPDWRLSSLITDSNLIYFSIDKYEISGVSLLSILYNPKLNG